MTKPLALPAAVLADEGAESVQAHELLSRALEAFQRFQEAQDDEEKAAALYVMYTMLEREAGDAGEAIRKETGLTFRRAVAVLTDRASRREQVERNGPRWKENVDRVERDLEYEAGIREHRG